MVVVAGGGPGGGGGKPSSAQGSLQQSIKYPCTSIRYIPVLGAPPPVCPVIGVGAAEVTGAGADVVGVGVGCDCCCCSEVVVVGGFC